MPKLKLKDMYWIFTNIIACFVWLGIFMLISKLVKELENYGNRKK